MSRNTSLLLKSSEHSKGRFFFLLTKIGHWTFASCTVTAPSITCTQARRHLHITEQQNTWNCKKPSPLKIMGKVFAIPLTVNYHHGIPCYWHVCYSEYKNRLVHVANCSQVFPCNSIHTYASRGFCHQDVAIVGSHDPHSGFESSWVYSVILSLPRLLSGQQDGGFVVVFFQLIFITGTHKIAQASLPSFLSATGTVEHLRAAGSQAPQHTHSCTKPSHCWCKSQHCTSRTWADLQGKPATLLA